MVEFPVEGFIDGFDTGLFCDWDSLDTSADCFSISAKISPKKHLE